MPGILFKVWSLTDKKMLFASTLQELVSSGKKKLSLNQDIDVRVYLEDGTEVDDDDILQSLESQTVMYLLQEHDMVSIKKYINYKLLFEIAFYMCFYSELSYLETVGNKSCYSN